MKNAVLAERLAAQLLSGTPSTDPLAVVKRLLAVQAQDLRGARLAIRARTNGLVATDVDRALTRDRSILITWLNRGTLHLVRTEDYPFLHALTTPQLASGNARRLAQEGVSLDAAARGVDVIERSLTREGPLTRGELGEKIASAGVRTQGQALVHILALASFRGIVVRGPIIGSDQAYVLVRDWVGAVPRVDREAALGELARRFLAGHGPASDRDLARWAGLSLRDSRAGMGALAGEIVQRHDGLVDLPGRGAVPELPPPRLLGPYEPVLLGWVSREDILGAHRSVVTVNGLFRPFAMVRGRAAATWKLARGRVELSPFGRLRPAEARALEADATDVKRFLST